MKHQIHTSPVVEAFLSADECPFCRLQRDGEQRAIRFFAGPSASYMEPEIRELTNRTGFCGNHIKKLYDYGNSLGSALMVQTHYADLLQELRLRRETLTMPKKRLFAGKNREGEPFWKHLQQRSGQCAICHQMEESMQRQYRVFFSLVKEEEFCRCVEQGKGFCVPHFAQLLNMAEKHLPQSKAAWFYPTVYRVMEDGMTRVKEDLDWFVEKHDYRYANADWKNSRDALPRAMQKLNGIYPSDPPYRKE